MKCPICKIDFARVMRHVKEAHDDLYKKECDLALQLYNDGMTLRAIGDSNKSLFSFGSGLSDLVAANVKDLDIIRVQRLKKSLQEGYANKKYSTAGRGRIKGKKFKITLKLTAKKWDPKASIDFPKTVNISTKPNAPPDEILVWCDNKLTNKFLRTKTEDERDEIAKDLLNYFLEYDFNNLKPDDATVRKDWEALKGCAAIITNGSVNNKVSTGNKIVRRFFSNLYEVKSEGRDSVIDVISDKVKLWSIIRNRIGNTLIYCDTVAGGAKRAQGLKKCCKECPGTGVRHVYPMNINPRMVMVQGAKSSGSAHHASVFKGSVAKAIYNKYVKDGDTILDYSAGFGMRCAGLMATGKDVKYLAYEPNQKTYDGLHEMAEFLGFKDHINIKKCGSEEEIFGENIADFAFSSPPYFTAEVYSSDAADKQCYNTYANYDEWLEKYWRKTVQNIKIMLKSGAVLAANIGNDSNDLMHQLKEDMSKIIEEEGFELVEIISMITSRSHLTNKLKTQNNSKLEPIFFYRNKK